MWRTPGINALKELFTDDATYRLAPFESPIGGIGATAAMWDTERRGPHEWFTLYSVVVAVHDDVAVVEHDPPAGLSEDLDRERLGLEVEAVLGQATEIRTGGR